MDRVVPAMVTFATQRLRSAFSLSARWIMTPELTNENVDRVFPVRRLQAMVAQSLHEFGFADRLVVGADQYPRNGPLHIDRLGKWKQTRQFFQAFSIREPIMGERVERSNLRVRPVHSGDRCRDTAKLGCIGDRPMVQVNLRDLNFIIAGTRQGAKDPGMGLGTSQAGEHRSVRDLAGLSRRHLEPMKFLVQSMVLVQRAHQVHIGRAPGVCRQPVVDHAHELSTLIGG